MSSAPPPMYAPVPPPPAQRFAPPPPQHSSYTPPNYGPVGTLPTIAGVALFAEKANKKFMAPVFIGLGVILTVVGLILMPTSAGFAAPSLCILFGVVLIVLGIYFRKNQVHFDLVCDAYGIHIRRGSRKTGPQPPETVFWQSISATRSWEKITQQSGGEAGGERRDQAFGLYVQNAVAFDTDETCIKQFKEFIALCNQHTPQLPYQWVQRKEAKGLPALETVGYLVKVPR